jgi:hypothetical protein
MIQILETIRCKNVTGYFFGAFTDTWVPSQVYPVSFEIKLSVNLRDQKYHLITSHWDNSYSTSDGFHMHLSTDLATRK